VVNTKNKLEIRNVRIEKLTKESAYISQGLQAGENLVVSSITAPIKGMDVAIYTKEKQIHIAKNERQE
jgi:hypothetical protein